MPSAKASWDTEFNPKTRSLTNVSEIMIDRSPQEHGDRLELESVYKLTDGT